jgi:hypothetical protein
MLVALFIFIDEDIDDPLYADPERDGVEPEVWDRVAELMQDIAEGDVEGDGTDTIESMEDAVIGWRLVPKTGLSFVAVVEDATPGQVERYLKALQKRYFEEVDDVRRPEREGVDDVVVDVIPPWEEEEED